VRSNTANRKKKGHKVNKQLQKETATYTTDCQCVDYDDETATETPAEYCRDWCHEDAKEYCWELINTWLTVNNNPQAVTITGKALTWRRVTGYAIVMPQDILGALTINGEFTISLTLEGDNLTACRYSHDEPTGASFVFAPATE
jgi:hypothetical protein